MPETTMVRTAASTTSGGDVPQAPIARRLRQPSWRDVRLLIGVALVLLSVVCGAVVVSGADRTTPTYAARHGLVPGEQLDASDLIVVGARLTGAPSPYLTAARGLRPGLVALRPVPSGELVPLSAVGDPSAVTTRPVTVPIESQFADGLSPGHLVDVWVARRRAEGASGYAEPERVASAVPIGERAIRRGALGSSSTTAVQVLVDGDVVPRLIHAVDDDARITLVPVPSGGARQR